MNHLMNEIYESQIYEFVILLSHIVILQIIVQITRKIRIIQILTKKNKMIQRFRSNFIIEINNTISQAKEITFGQSGS